MKMETLEVQLQALALESECFPKTIAATENVSRRLAAPPTYIETEGHRVTQRLW
jgi:hypothetical protein